MRQEQLATLCQHVIPLTVPSGSIVFRQNQIPDYIYFLKKGHCLLVHDASVKFTTKTPSLEERQSQLHRDALLHEIQRIYTAEHFPRGSGEPEPCHHFETALRQQAQLTADLIPRHHPESESHTLSWNEQGLIDKDPKDSSVVQSPSAESDTNDPASDWDDRNSETSSPQNGSKEHSEILDPTKSSTVTEGNPSIITTSSSSLPQQLQPRIVKFDTAYIGPGNVIQGTLRELILPPPTITQLVALTWPPLAIPAPDLDTSRLYRNKDVSTASAPIARLQSDAEVNNPAQDEALEETDATLSEGKTNLEAPICMKPGEAHVPVSESFSSQAILTHLQQTSATNLARVYRGAVDSASKLLLGEDAIARRKSAMLTSQALTHQHSAASSENLSHIDTTQVASPGVVSGNPHELVELYNPEYDAQRAVRALVRAPMAVRSIAIALGYDESIRGIVRGSGGGTDKPPSALGPDSTLKAKAAAALSLASNEDSETPTRARKLLGHVPEIVHDNANLVAHDSENRDNSRQNQATSSGMVQEYQEGSYFAPRFPSTIPSIISTSPGANSDFLTHTGLSHGPKARTDVDEVAAASAATAAAANAAAAADSLPPSAAASIASGPSSVIRLSTGATVPVYPQIGVTLGVLGEGDLIGLEDVIKSRCHSTAAIVCTNDSEGVGVKGTKEAIALLAIPASLFLAVIRRGEAQTQLCQELAAARDIIHRRVYSSLYRKDFRLARRRDLATTSKLISHDYTTSKVTHVQAPAAMGAGSSAAKPTPQEQSEDSATLVPCDVVNSLIRRAPSATSAVQLKLNHVTDRLKDAGARSWSTLLGMKQERAADRQTPGSRHNYQLNGPVPSESQKRLTNRMRDELGRIGCVAVKLAHSTKELAMLNWQRRRELRRQYRKVLREKHKNSMAAIGYASSAESGVAQDSNGADSTMRDVAVSSSAVHPQVESAHRQAVLEVIREHRNQRRRWVRETRRRLRRQIRTQAEDGIDITQSLMEIAGLGNRGLLFQRMAKSGTSHTVLQNALETYRGSIAALAGGFAVGDDVRLAVVRGAVRRERQKVNRKRRAKNIARAIAGIAAVDSDDDESSDVDNNDSTTPGKPVHEDDDDDDSDYDGADELDDIDDQEVDLSSDSESVSDEDVVDTVFDDEDDDRRPSTSEGQEDRLNLPSRAKKKSSGSRSQQSLLSLDLRFPTLDSLRSKKFGLLGRSTSFKSESQKRIRRIGKKITLQNDNGIIFYRAPGSQTVVIPLRKTSLSKPKFSRTGGFGGIIQSSSNGSIAAATLALKRRAKVAAKARSIRLGLTDPKVARSLLAADWRMAKVHEPQERWYTRRSKDLQAEFILNNHKRRVDARVPGSSVAVSANSVRSTSHQQETPRAVVIRCPVHGVIGQVSPDPSGGTGDDGYVAHQTASQWLDRPEDEAREECTCNVHNEVLTATAAAEDVAPDSHHSSGSVLSLFAKQNPLATTSMLIRSYRQALQSSAPTAPSAGSEVLPLADTKQLLRVTENQPALVYSATLLRPKSPVPKGPPLNGQAQRTGDGKDELPGFLAAPSPRVGIVYVDPSGNGKPQSASVALCSAAVPATTQPSSNSAQQEQAGEDELQPDVTKHVRTNSSIPNIVRPPQSERGPFGYSLLTSLANNSAILERILPDIQNDVTFPNHRSEPSIPDPIYRLAPSNMKRFAEARKGGDLIYIRAAEAECLAEQARAGGELTTLLAGFKGAIDFDGSSSAAQSMEARSLATEFGPNESQGSRLSQGAALRQSSPRTARGASGPASDVGSQRPKDMLTTVLSKLSRKVAQDGNRIPVPSMPKLAALPLVTRIGLSRDVIDRTTRSEVQAMGGWGTKQDDEDQAKSKEVTLKRAPSVASPSGKTNSDQDSSVTKPRLQLVQSLEEWLELDRRNDENGIQPPIPPRLATCFRVRKSDVPKCETNQLQALTPSRPATSGVQDGSEPRPPIHTQRRVQVPKMFSHVFNPINPAPVEHMEDQLIPSLIRQESKRENRNVARELTTPSAFASTEALIERALKHSTITDESTLNSPEVVLLKNVGQLPESYHSAVEALPHQRYPPQITRQHVPVRDKEEPLIRTEQGWVVPLQVRTVILPPHLMALKEEEIKRQEQAIEEEKAARRRARQMIEEAEREKLLMQYLSPEARRRHRAVAEAKKRALQRLHAANASGSASGDDQHPEVEHGSLTKLHMPGGAADVQEAALAAEYVQKTTQPWERIPLSIAQAQAPSTSLFRKAVESLRLTSTTASLAIQAMLPGSNDSFGQTATILPSTAPPGTQGRKLRGSHASTLREQSLLDLARIELESRNKRKISAQVAGAGGDIDELREKERKSLDHVVKHVMTQASCSLTSPLLPTHRPATARADARVSAAQMAQTHTTPFSTTAPLPAPGRHDLPPIVDSSSLSRTATVVRPSCPTDLNDPRIRLQRKAKPVDKILRVAELVRQQAAAEQTKQLTATQGNSIPPHTTRW